MRKFASILVVLVGSTFASADIPVPPPEFGTKYVEMHNYVVLDPGVTRFKFVIEVGQGPGLPKRTFSAVSLSERPTEMPVGGKYTYGTLLAIPKDEAGKFKNDAELHAALEKGTINDVSKLPFASTGMASTKHAPDFVNATYTITGFEKGRGLVWRAEREDKQQKTEASSEKPFPTSATENHEAVASSFSGTRLIIMGACLAAAVVGLGLWLVARSGKPRIVPSSMD